MSRPLSRGAFATSRASHDSEQGFEATRSVMDEPPRRQVRQGPSSKAHSNLTVGPGVVLAVNKGLQSQRSMRSASRTTRRNRQPAAVATAHPGQKIPPVQGQSEPLLALKAKHLIILGVLGGSSPPTTRGPPRRLAPSSSAQGQRRPKLGTKTRSPPQVAGPALRVGS